MPAFLSPAWLSALDQAARHDPALAEAASGVALVVEQTVTGGPDGAVTYHVAFDDGRVAVVAGPAAEATVRFSQDHETAVAIATGAASAQRAFMTGRLQVGGDLRALLDHQAALGALQDVFAEVRSDTTFPVVAGPGGDAVDA